MNKIPLHIADLLNEKVIQYKQAFFIQDDPISIPHLFNNRQDVEIAGFLTALISWGNRKSIIRSATQLINIMHYQPYNFILNYSRVDNKYLKSFYYRTFQPADTIFYIKALSNYYKNYDSLEEIFVGEKVVTGIKNLREELLHTPHLKRSEKHLPDMSKNAAGKRINMFLRWMVRKDEVDFGLWEQLSPSELLIPLDVHTARVAYTLGLLKNQKSCLTNVLELTELLKTLDNQDPVKYDFALFGMGVYEKTKAF